MNKKLNIFNSYLVDWVLLWQTHQVNLFKQLVVIWYQAEAITQVFDLYQEVQENQLVVSTAQLTFLHDQNQFQLMKIWKTFQEVIRQENHPHQVDTIFQESVITQAGKTFLYISYFFRI